MCWDELLGRAPARSPATGGPTNGALSVADPRAPGGAEQFGHYDVNGWADSMGAVICVKSSGQGGFGLPIRARARR